jgi:glycosyltransferase involved in cell wall biosynthesis
VLRTRPAAVYLIDVGVSTTLCAVLARALGAFVVLDTGDLAFELARSLGTRSRLGLGAVWLGEQLAIASSHHVVIRGRAHAGYIRQRPTTYVPDLPPPGAGPMDGSRLRAELGLADSFVVGLVGSLSLAPRLGIAYGWDLIEALPQTPPRVVALIVGDGDGRTLLERRSEELAVADRCRFVGRVPSDKVAEWIAVMDVGVSTQTNDPVGTVRTTGKLPLYLACGCPVLASDVGEARRLLRPLGWTVPYEGVVDRQYPRRLAAVISQWASDSAGSQASRARQAGALARTAFDAREMRGRVMGVIECAS